MKRSVLFIVLFLGINLYGGIVSAAGLVEESAILDRAYIPALAFTNFPDKPQSAVEQSVLGFVAAWEHFLRSIPAEDSRKAPLREAIRLSSEKVDEARSLVAANKRKDAHEALETIRTSFARARGALGIDYLPDRFTAFHDPMEKFADLAEKPGTEPVKLKALLAELSALWKAVEERRLDTRLFNVSLDRAKQYEEQVKKEREILTRLEGLIASGKNGGIAAAATALKRNFAQTYFVFGDFSRLP